MTTTMTWWRFFRFFFRFLFCDLCSAVTENKTHLIHQLLLVRCQSATMTFSPFVHYLLLVCFFRSFCKLPICSVRKIFAINLCTSLYSYTLRFPILDAITQTHTTRRRWIFIYFSFYFVIPFERFFISQIMKNFYKSVAHISHLHIITAWLHHKLKRLLCDIFLFLLLLQFWHFKTSSSILDIYRTINCFPQHGI